MAVLSAKLTPRARKQLIKVDPIKGYGIKKIGDVYVFSDGNYESLIVDSKKGYE